jgi:hypothetical protein
VRRKAVTGCKITTGFSGQALGGIQQDVRRYPQRVGNARRVTDEVNIPELKNRPQRRMGMIMETARKLTEGSADPESVLRPGSADTPAALPR